MEEIIKQFTSKLSSYDIFNNLYPGILFCYFSKIILKVNILTDNWFENLFLFYFIGMIISRIGSLIIEPIIKSIKFKKKRLVTFAPYKDYINASRKDSTISILSETNNTYRTLLSCFISIFFLKVFLVINGLLIKKGFFFIDENKDWIVLILIIAIFICSYIKQISYVRKRVENVLNQNNN